MFFVLFDFFSNTNFVNLFLIQKIKASDLYLPAGTHLPSGVPLYFSSILLSIKKSCTLTSLHQLL